MNENMPHDESDHPAPELQVALLKDLDWVRSLFEKTERVLRHPDLPLEQANLVLDAVATGTAHLLQSTGLLAGALVLRLEKDAGIEALERIANGE